VVELYDLVTYVRLSGDTWETIAKSRIPR
jgi:hypothetical protein